MSSELPRNIELFNRIAAVALVRLYEAFPDPLDLDSGAIGREAAQHALSDAEAFDIIINRATNSISFLVEERFLRYDLLTQDNGSLLLS